jgi:hypothetical protein
MRELRQLPVEQHSIVSKQVSVACFTVLSVCPKPCSSNGRTNDEMERSWKQAARYCFDICLEE